MGNAPKNVDNAVILVVDDVPENLQVIGSLLGKHNYDIRVASRGQQALDSAFYEPPDLVLLDISMPGINGYEVCRRLRDNPVTSEVPVIFLTAAHVSPEQMQEGFEAGAVDYITKPVDDLVLVARVRTHVALRQSRQLLEEQNRGLQQANDAKNKLFSILGHDLKNVFSGINTLLELMVRDYTVFDDRQRRDFLQEMMNASRHALTLLDDILEWSRLQRGLVAVHMSAVPLGPVLEDIVDLFETQAAHKGVKVSGQWDSVELVKADPNMLTTVLRNLVSNAVKFTPEGGTVTLSAETQSDGERVVVHVKDSGVGMNKKTRESLFRADGGTTPGTDGEKGTGLGLLICRELIQNQGGEIWARSEPGHGSTFSFSLRPVPPAE